VQTKSVLFTLAFSGIVTFIILKLLDATISLRVTREQEVEGLDLALHDERAYNSQGYRFDRRPFPGTGSTLSPLPPGNRPATLRS
jgi:hypothetical protein